VSKKKKVKGCKKKKDSKEEALLGGTSKRQQRECPVREKRYILHRKRGNDAVVSIEEGLLSETDDRKHSKLDRLKKIKVIPKLQVQENSARKKRKKPLSELKTYPWKKSRQIRREGLAAEKGLTHAQKDSERENEENKLRHSRNKLVDRKYREISQTSRSRLNHRCRSNQDTRHTSIKIEDQ